MAKQKKNYSEQFLEAATESAELALNPRGICEIYGQFCFLEGKWIYAYAVEKVVIEEELYKLACKHDLIKASKK
jgi:hypothetical protein